MAQQNRRYTHVRLQIDYGGRPLWGSIDGKSLIAEEISPSELGLSKALTERLDSWVEDFYKQMGSPEATARMEAGRMPEGSRFLAEGFRIAGDLQEELGDDVIVYYFRNLAQPEYPHGPDFDGAEPDWRV